MMAWHARALQEATVMALLGVLTLLPARGSGQLAQLKVKRATRQGKETTSCIMLALAALHPAAERTFPCISH